MKLGGESGIILAKGTAEVNLKITMTWDRRERGPVPMGEYKAATVRVRCWRDGRPATAGLGLLVGAGQVVTCAHVVNMALGRGQDERAGPGRSDVVQVEFRYCLVPRCVMPGSSPGSRRAVRRAGAVMYAGTNLQPAPFGPFYQVPGQGVPGRVDERPAAVAREGAASPSQSSCTVPPVAGPATANCRHTPLRSLSASG